jgi:hypothetical protein
LDGTNAHVVESLLGSREAMSDPSAIDATCSFSRHSLYLEMKLLTKKRSPRTFITVQNVMEMGIAPSFKLRED